MPPLRLPASSGKIVQRIVHCFARLTRPLTMGVRAVLIDRAGRVFLVKHSYVPGWHCPGGAVEVGETVRDALVREVREEGAIEILGEPELHGIFLNRSVSRRDHVVVYVVRDFRQLGPRPADWEIVDTGFFSPEALPEGTTAATRARLDEVLNGVGRADVWSPPQRAGRPD